MNIVINGKTYETISRTVSELINEQNPTPPFAIAINLHFVPQAHYSETEIKEWDEIEIVSPMTGG